MTQVRPAVQLLAVLLLAACSSGSSTTPGHQAAVPKPAEAGSGSTAPRERLLRGSPPPSALAHRPRFKRSGESKPGLRTIPDGDLEEWSQAGVSWLELGPAGGGGTGSTSAPASAGAASLSGKFALASYGSGLSLALQVHDDSLRHAKASSALGQSDHVEIELWPRETAERPSQGGGRSATARPRDLAVGVRIRLGTLRQLVQVLRPQEPWREASISAFGAETPDGYTIEARLPLSALTPLPAARLSAVSYRITVHDADETEPAARPGLRLEGTAGLEPALEVPEAVQLRSSVRACMASQPEALWGYQNGWRCSIPYLEEDSVIPDDAEPGSDLRLGHALLPDPPKLIWIRERVIFVNLEGVNRAVAALYDRKDTLLSLLPLGVVGALDPGSTWAKDSDAEPLKLPDGTWAVAVTHAYPAAEAAAGGRCAAGHRVFLSIIALRGCLVSTPQQPAPPPPFAPYLEEVFRVSLEDCQGTSASDWVLSEDHRTIQVHDSLYPRRPPRTYRFQGGRYLSVEG